VRPAIADCGANKVWQTNESKERFTVVESCEKLKDSGVLINDSDANRKNWYKSVDRRFCAVERFLGRQGAMLVRYIAKLA